MEDPIKTEDIITNSKLTDEAAPSQVDIIHVLRSAQAHHVSLGIIADQKANIVLGTFLVFLTVTQSLLKSDAALTVPIWILSVSFSMAAVFALLVITPRFRDKKTDKHAVPKNLLFFGSFHHLGQDEYVDMLYSHLKSDEEAHRLFIKDIYQIGQVLQKKYQNLRRSYVVLAAGIITAIIALSIEMII